MKTIGIFGAGFVTKPLVDYFLNKEDYNVILANRTLSKAENIIGDRNNGRAVELPNLSPNTIDAVVAQSDIVISMLSPSLHVHITESCLRNGKNMLTSSYEQNEIADLDKVFKKEGLLVVNELGEDPGMDHFGTQLVLDNIRKDNGKIISLKSYGSGIPAPESNNNPFNYKFSWSPKGFLKAGKAPAVYFDKGKIINVPGDELFNHCKDVSIHGLGDFETYPNRDSTKYLSLFGLNKEVTFYRGLLRYRGYCDNIKNMINLGLFDVDEVHNFEGMTYRAFTASLINSDANGTLENEIAKSLGIKADSQFIQNLKWLGLFGDDHIKLTKGSKGDVLLEKMTERMTYKPHEKDMTIIYIDALAEFPDGHRETREAMMVMKGIPYGDSAMSRSVSLPVAITTKMILDGKVDATGVRTPLTLPELYKPVLKEMAQMGYKFELRNISKEKLIKENN